MAKVSRPHFGAVQDASGAPVVFSSSGIGRRTLLLANTHLADVLRAASEAHNWTTLQFNVNVPSTWHSDAGNLGATITLALGCFTGGELELAHQTLWNSRESAVVFNARLPHRARSHDGSWCFISFYQHPSRDSLSKRMRGRLKAFGLLS